MPNGVLQAAVLVLTVKLATGCGGYLVGSGNITSPNYPSLYPQNSRCTWTFAASPGQYISLRLLHLDTEDAYDYVYVSNAESTEKTYQCDYVNRFSGRYYDSKDNTKTLLVRPKATVMFVSDSSNLASGFQMEYTTVNTAPFSGCGGYFIGSGSITSPNYPNFYPMNSRCTWTIAAHPGEYISLRLINLDTERSHDQVYIYNGTANSTDPYLCELVDQYSGYNDYSNYDTKALVIGPSVTVIFFSDNSISASGFQMEYTSVNIALYSDCGGNLFGSGNIISPNYPSFYPMNTRCTWTLTANPGEFISLAVHSVETEDLYDYVLIYNGTTTVNTYLSNYVKKYSGVYNINNVKAFVIGPSATVVFNSDTSTSASGFLIEYESIDLTNYTDCGGRLVGSGDIASPYFPSSYPLNSHCTWYLAANPGSLISLTIMSINTEYFYDHVSIYYGTPTVKSHDANYAYRYSGNSIYDSKYGITKSFVIGPTATIVFISDSSHSASGFKMEFTSVNVTSYTDCGGSLFFSGNITSPNYPNRYPNNSRCTWTLSASAGYAISLRLINVDTELSYDYAHIYNGSASATNYIGNYTGLNYYSRYYQQSNKPLLLGPVVTVLFISDSFVSASGFQIEYTSVNATTFTDCGGSLIGSGNITSPNYPNLYPNNSRCTWTLSASAGYAISLRLINVDTEYSDDYVNIYNGSRTTNNYIAKYSGREYYGSNHYGSTKSLLLGPVVTVSFISDGFVSASGFQIEYTSVNATPFTDCGGSLFGSGNITSPNYPNFYPDNSRCTWTVSARSGFAISLRLIIVDTEYSEDYVNIYNGSTTMKNFISKYSGRNHNVGTKPLLLGPVVTVLFISDGSVTASGFQIEYTSFNATPFTDCGGSVFGSGNITSPNYPNFYPTNSRCAWTLSASSGYSIALRIILIDTEYFDDYVNIYRGSTTTTNFFSSYSGSTDGAAYYYSSTKPLLIGPVATVLFISDGSDSASGFQIEYTSVNATPFTDCGGSLVGSGNITSPNYPNRYPNPCRCIWTLSASAGDTISLRLINVDTESYDHVTIYNGSSTTKYYISSYSGRNYNGSYNYASIKPQLLGPVATVLFTSDSSFSGSGFQIEYTSFNATPFTDCGGYLFGSGNITSPNYPNFYPSNSRCTWTISPIAGHAILLRLINVDTESPFDYVDIYNGSATGINYIISYTGRDYYGSNYASEKPLLLWPVATVVFYSDSFVSASGFQIEYTNFNYTPFTDCGGHLVSSGKITSPNYPSFYPSRSRCTWTISAGAGYSILLSPINVDTESSNDYVNIYNGSAIANNYVFSYSGRRYYYGRSNDGSVHSKKPLLLGPNVTVLFISDSSISASGFQMEYTIFNTTPFTDCGGYLVGSGNITSPNYPNFYPANSRCTWTLAASPNRSISLRLINIDTESPVDNVVIYNGTSIVHLNQYIYIYRNWERYSIDGDSHDSRKPVIIGPRVTVVFNSDSSVSGTGFQIEYTSVSNSIFSEFNGAAAAQQSRCYMLAFSSFFVTVLWASSRSSYIKRCFCIKYYLKHYCH